MFGPESRRFAPQEEARNELEKRQEVFREYYPEGRLEAVKIEDIPKPALASLEERSQYLVHPDRYKPGNFEDLYLIVQPDGSRTYVASQTKQYGAEGDVERLTFLAELDSKGEFAGYGEIRLGVSNKSDYFVDKPFVGFTKTEPGKARQGLGLRRLHEMNAVTEAQYGLPLYSDTLMTPDAERLWKKLVEKGDARAFEEKSGGQTSQRYVFAKKRRDE